MVGNCHEWTSEYAYDETVWGLHEATYRGGCYDYSIAGRYEAKKEDMYAANRFSIRGDDGEKGYSFRIQLYIK